jgi:phosphoenolpyruvate synthase/pyruvate phosphate dikinase
LFSRATSDSVRGFSGSFRGTAVGVGASAFAEPAVEIGVGAESAKPDRIETSRQSAAQ